MIRDRLWRQRYNADPNVVGRLLEIKAASTRSPASCRRLQLSLTTWMCGCVCSGISRSTAAARTSWKRSRGCGRASRRSRRRATWRRQRPPRRKRAPPPTAAGWPAGAAARRHAGLLPARPLRAARRRRPAAADRLPERRQPAAGARHRTRAGDCGARGAWCLAARLLRQMLVESLLLSLAGTAAGAFGGAGAPQARHCLAAAGVPRLAQVTVDLRLLGVALAIVAGTALCSAAAGAGPVATQAAEALKDGSRGRDRRARPAMEPGACRHRSRARLRGVDGLGAAGTQRSRMLHASTGVSPSGVVTATLQLPTAAYPDWPEVDQGYHALLESIRTQPGVGGAARHRPRRSNPGGACHSGLTAGRCSRAILRRAARVHQQRLPRDRRRAHGGRSSFTNDDRIDTEPVVVVNESFARRVFPGGGRSGQTARPTAQHRAARAEPDGARPIPDRGRRRRHPPGTAGRRGEPVIYHSLRQFPFAR